MLEACWAPSLTRALRGESERVSITVGCTWILLTCVCASAYQNVSERLGGGGCRDSDLHNKAERAILGERSGEERRRRKNTPRMLWLNMIRETHMARLRQNQMPSEVPMKHELKANMSPHYESEHILGNKPK